MVNRYRKSITLPNDVQKVPELNVFVDEVCEQAGLDATMTMKMNLAIEEAVVNVMDYAYPDGTKGDVVVEATVDENGLTFVIIDSGKRFDPTVSPTADTTLSAEERPIGGLGIFLVRQLMDEEKYEYKEGRNVLRLTKNLSPALPQGEGDGTSPGPSQGGEKGC